VSRYFDDEDVFGTDAAAGGAIPARMSARAELVDVEKNVPSAHGRGAGESTANGEGPVKPHTVYCSGCDRNVQVLMEDPGHDDAQASVHDPEIICLEIGEWCTGALCPLGAAEPTAMVSRLIRNGLPLDHVGFELAFCEGCGMTSTMAMYGLDMEACTVCGTTRHRAAPRRQAAT
jgi:hypothetical protein